MCLVHIQTLEQQELFSGEGVGGDPFLFCSIWFHGSVSPPVREVMKLSLGTAFIHFMFYYGDPVCFY